MNDDSTQTIAVTGASGQLGSRVSSLLAARGLPVITISRQTSLLPDLPNVQRRGPAEYSDSRGMRQALAGSSTVVLISGRLNGRRLEDHATVINAARASGADRIIYISLVGASPTATYKNARDHWLTEHLLIESGLRHTILRSGIYAADLARVANSEYVIKGPGEQGKAAFVGHDDIASAIAVVAADETSRFDGQVLELTGSQSITIEDAAAQISAATSLPYRYQPEGLHEAFVNRAKIGMPGDQIEGWLSWYQAIALGHVDRVSNAIEDIVGTRPKPVKSLTNWPEPNGYLDQGKLIPLL